MGDSTSAGTIQQFNTKSTTIVLLPEVTSDELIIEPIPNSLLKLVHFKLPNIIVEDGSILHGKIPMMRPPEQYKLPTSQDLQFGVDWVENWMMENKLIRKYETDKRAKTRQIAQDLFTLFAATSSALDCISGVEVSITDERILMLITGIQLIFVVDDIIEETNLLGRNQSMGAVAANYIDEILKGNFELETDESVFPSLRPAAKAAQGLFKKARALYPDFHFKSEYFAKAVKATYSGVHLLQVADGKLAKVQNGNGNGSKVGKSDDDNDTMPEDIFICLRRADAAGLASIEIMLCAQEIDLATEIRENLFFKKCLEIIEEIIGHQNDLLGLEKDIKNDELNIVLFKVKKYGISLQDAFDAVIKRVGKLIREFEYLESHLRKLYPENEDLEDFFESAYSVMDGNGYLMLHTERHGDLRTAFASVKN